MNTVVRAPAWEEAEAIAALLNAHAAALHGEADVTAGFVAEWLEDPDLAMRLAVTEGEHACYGDLMVSPDGTRADLDVREHPSHPGVANAMLDELERVARERGAVSVRAYAAVGEVSMLAVLADRGYRAVRHSFRMQIALDAEIAEPKWPEGVVVRTMVEGEERAVHEANNDAFSDDWHFQPQSFESWARWNLGGERFDRSLKFVAADGADIAGICLSSLHWSGDPGYGWVGILGVRPVWRRRGLGLALLQNAFAEFRRRGCNRVGLGVDGENATGAVELYERAGMHGERRQDTFEKSLV